MRFQSVEENDLICGIKEEFCSALSSTLHLCVILNFDPLPQASE